MGTSEAGNVWRWQRLRLFLEYGAGDASRLLGIECKYAEDLAKSAIKPIRSYTYSKGPRTGQRPRSHVKYQDHTETAGS